MQGHPSLVGLPRLNGRAMEVGLEVSQKVSVEQVEAVLGLVEGGG